MKSLLVLLRIFAATVVADAEVGHTYYDDYGREEESPTFIASPQDFKVEVNDDITFPCEVENLGSELLMFRHILPDGESRMIFIGNISLKEKAKFTKKGNSFVLSGVSRRHAGKYQCRIETDTVVQLMHTLDVQYPATVRRISPAEQRVAKGSSVTLECAGDGNPKAAINWSKQRGLLPSGAQAVEGLSLTLQNVDRHVEGTYICTASNGVGPPSSTTMSIEVEYPPEIITEKTMMHTGEGELARLICIVHGRPLPSVAWRKDGKILPREDSHQDHNGLHKHMLTIHNVQDGDFGDYTCVAQNPHGETHHTLRLTGLPKTPRMTSSPAGGERSAYTITWETESNAPITQYRLKYRRAMGNTSSHRMWDDRLYSPQQPRPRDLPINGLLHRMSHPLLRLEAATDYEALVSVENKFGWSNNSETFRFYTRKEDPTTTTTTTITTTTTTISSTTTTLAPGPENIAPLLEEVAVGQSASGSDRMVVSASLLLMMQGAFVY